MCGRYRIHLSKNLSRRFHVGVIDEENFLEGESFPTQYKPVITNEEPNRLQYFRWGLIPHWAKDEKIGNKMINARAETVLEKPAYRESFYKRRCLVIADSFYEWKKIGEKQKQRMEISLEDEEFFAMAGLWDRWTDKSSGEIIYSFTILTTEPNETIRPIHNRMPVILPLDKEEKWIDSNASEKELLSILNIDPALNVIPITEYDKSNEENYSLFGE